MRESHILTGDWLRTTIFFSVWFSLTIVLAAEPTPSQRTELPADWAFAPMPISAWPEVNDASWPLSHVDCFILSSLERENLRPVADAGRSTWLRRVSFDLTGLPPSVEQITRFQADRSPLARQRIVDRLLASPAFGERWARHWLDLVGYADQIGTSNNIFAEYAWRYRDYLIDVFNDDIPFDHFIRQQIAGDLLPTDSIPQRVANLVATGFLVLGDVEIVEADKAKLRVDVVDQQVNKVSKTFLGMTLACARCHDHKFDPITQHDYYGVAGMFHSTDSVYVIERGVWSSVTALELPETEAQLSQRNSITQQHAIELAEMKAERDQATAKKQELETLANDGTATDGKETDISQTADGAQTAETLRQQIEQLVERIGELDRLIIHAEFFTPQVPKTYGVRDSDQPADMKITIRGNPRALGDSVPRGFIKAVACSQTSLPSIPAGESGRRQLADWVASPDNSLTARVTVNRIWQKLFGQGLVRSVDYFGVRGEAPSHPRLLSHLATDFASSGWSQKRLMRRLVLNRVYRLGSEHDAQASAVDPDIRLLWRMPPQRLDAEALRDALLEVTGKLRRCGGGPAIPLEFPENVANLDPKSVNPPSFVLNKFRPEQEYLRTIYLPVIRHAAQPGPAELRNVFDFVQPATCSGQRTVTAVPTQALFLMNSDELKQRAGELAARVSSHSDEDTDRLEFLWLCTLNRAMTAEERTEALVFLSNLREIVQRQAEGESADAGEADPWVELCHAVLASNEFLMRL